MAPVADLPLADVAVLVAHAHLELTVGGFASCPGDVDPVLPRLLHAHMLEVRGHVRGEVVGRVLELVDNLLLAGHLADKAAAVRQLGDHQVSVLPDLRNGEAQVPQVRHVLPPRVAEVASRHLAGALQQVPRQSALPQPGVVLPVPAELVHQGPQHQGRVRHPAGDHQVGALAQRFHNSRRAQVGVGGDDVLLQLSQGTARLHGGLVLPFRQPVQHVVPGDRRNFNPLHPQSLGHLAGFPGGGQGVCRSHVGDHLYGALFPGLENPFHPVWEQGVVPQLRVGQPLQLGQGDGPFRQALEDDVIQISSLHQGDGGLDPVPAVPRPGADAQCSHLVGTPFSRGRITREGVSRPVRMVCMAGVVDSCSDQIPALLGWMAYWGKSEEERSSRSRQPACTW